MDIFFQDPTEIPLPPAEVRLRALHAEPWPDGKRVKVTLEVDPFQSRPNAEISIRQADGTQVAQVSIIESMTRKMEFNMHLRSPQPGGEYTLQATIYYEQPPSAEALPAEERPAPQVVDRGELTFTLPAA